jgi:hypothetical protein
MSFWIARVVKNHANSFNDESRVFDAKAVPSFLWLHFAGGIGPDDTAATHPICEHQRPLIVRSLVDAPRQTDWKSEFTELPQLGTVQARRHKIGRSTHGFLALSARKD